MKSMLQIFAMWIDLILHVYGVLVVRLLVRMDCIGSASTPAAHWVPKLFGGTLNLAQ